MEVPLSVCDFIDRAVHVYPRRVAIIDEPAQPAAPLDNLTYEDVHRLAAAQAAALDRMGIGFGERVAIVSKNAARMLVSFFGVSAYGRVLVPINFRLTPDEVRYIVEHSGASLLLIDAELAESLAGVPCPRRIVLDESGDAELYCRNVAPDAWETDENATATINYTSGTTARPKGVQITHRNIWMNATVFGLHAGVNDRDVYLWTLPMFHCNGWGMPYILSAMGAKQIVMRQVDGMEILRLIDRHGVTFLCGAPTVVSMVLEAARSWEGPIPGRDRVRMVVAGAPPPTEVIERMESELGWEFIQIYGLTETSPLLTMNRSRAEYDELSPEARAQQFCRAGVPTLGVRLGVSEAGELLARGNVVLQGYWDDPEATSGAIKDGWFHTGDGGFVDEDGYVHITDRKKDVIISGGENVSSIEVEDTLFSHPSVHEVAVIGVPDEKWGETVKALVVLKPHRKLTEPELISYCRDHLAHFKCPTSVEFRDELPRTATGKLQKFKLREPYWQGRSRHVN